MNNLNYSYKPFDHLNVFTFQVTTWDTISRFLCASCVAAASSTNDPEGSSDVGGYMTPRSIETPVGGGGHHLTQVSHLTKSSSAYPETGFSSSSHQIRDPYASRLPPTLRASSKSTKSDGDELNLHTQAEHQLHTHKPHQAQTQNPRHHHHHHNHHHHHHLQKCKESQQQNNSLQQVSDHDKAESDNDDNSIYTILIRFPPASATIESSSGQRHKSTAKNGGNYSTNNISDNLQRSKSVHDTGHLDTGHLQSNQHPHRTSIQMLLELPDDESTPMVRTDMPSSSKVDSTDKSINGKPAYSKSLPARGRNTNKGGRGGSSTSGTTNSSSQRSSHSTTHNTSLLTSADTPGTPKCCKNQSSVSTVDGNISRLPLDARLVPKQLLKVRIYLLLIVECLCSNSIC